MLEACGMLKRYMEHLHDAAAVAYRAELLDCLERQPSARLVDLGCDEGTWTERLANRIGTKHIFGVDLVEERYRHACDRGIQVREADLNDTIPFADASFDVVHSNQVIEHVQDLDRFVDEVHRVLTPGGYAVICSENLASWHNILALLLGLQPFSLTNISRTGALGNPFGIHVGVVTGLIEYKTFFHTRVLAYQAFREIFERHGLRVERIGGTGYHPLPPFLARPMARLDPRHSHFIYVKVRKTARAGQARSSPT